jgi:hypothetical protein
MHGPRVGHIAWKPLAGVQCDQWRTRVWHATGRMNANLSHSAAWNSIILTAFSDKATSGLDWAYYTLIHK